MLQHYFVSIGHISVCETGICVGDWLIAFSPSSRQSQPQANRQLLIDIGWLSADRVTRLDIICRRLELRLNPSLATDPIIIKLFLWSMAGPLRFSVLNLLCCTLSAVEYLATNPSFIRVSPRYL